MYLKILFDLVTKLCLTLVTPWTAAHQAPPSMGFSRQEYWSGVPLPSPGHTCNSIKIIETKMEPMNV